MSPKAVPPEDAPRPAPEAAWPPAPAPAPPQAPSAPANGASTAPHGHTTPQASPHQTTWDQPHGGSRRGLVVVGGVVLAGGLALGIGALALSGGGDGKGGTGAKPAPPSPAVPQGRTAAAPQPIPASQLAATRPRKVVARQVGRTAALLWTLPPGARGLPLLVQQQPAGTQPIVTVKAGSQSATMPGLRPNTAYCFKVGTVLRLNQGQAPDVAWSAPACVGKGKKRPRR
ncbi:hypothetical protein GWI34_32070 [Actinomadura sp. DSM 109109]|nr:hypothetical protein [Actinomadura lepetitiana]